MANFVGGGGEVGCNVPIIIQEIAALDVIIISLNILVLIIMSNYVVSNAQVSIEPTEGPPLQLPSSMLHKQKAVPRKGMLLPSKLQVSLTTMLCFHLQKLNIF